MVFFAFAQNENDKLTLSKAVETALLNNVEHSRLRFLNTLHDYYKRLVELEQYMDFELVYD